MEQLRVPEPTDAVFGDYTLVRPIAEGGMASVYLARLRRGEFTKWVALKLIHPRFTGDERFERMFLSEARVVARVDHPNVCSVFDFGRVDGQAYLAMEYLRGQTVLKVIKTAKEAGIAISPTFWARVVADAALGLHAAHEARHESGRPLNLVHRDISPHNVMVLYSGVTKVLDFGIAKTAEPEESDLTAVDELKGKLSYMSPEQMRREPLDRRSDVFALGATLWEATCARPLFRRGNKGDTVLAILQDPVQRPSEVVEDYPPELEKIVMRALERERDARTASAADLAAELDGFIRESDQPCGAREVSQLMDRLFHEEIESSHSDLELIATRAEKLLSASGRSAPEQATPATFDSRPARRPLYLQLAVIAAVALAASGLGFWLADPENGRPDPPPDGAPVEAEAPAAAPVTAAAPPVQPRPNRRRSGRRRRAQGADGRIRTLGSPGEAGPTLATPSARQEGQNAGADAAGEESSRKREPDLPFRLNLMGRSRERSRREPGVPFRTIRDEMPRVSRRWRAALTTGFTVGCIVLVGSSALAQRTRRQSQPEGPPEEAVELFEQATTHYREGRFESAAEMLRAAYEIHPDPTFLYNLGRALESAGDQNAAIEAYNGYLESPEAPQRRAAEARRDRLQEQLEERQQLEEEREAAERERMEAELRSELSTQSRPSTAEPTGSGPNPAPWIVLGVGGAGLIAGTVVGIVAQSRFDEAESAASQVEADAAKADADNLATIANVFWIGSGLIAAGGLIWGLIDLTSGGGASEDAQVQVRPDGVRIRF